MSTTQYKPVDYLHVVLIGGIGFFLAIPILVNGCLDGHDSEHHLIWSTYFAQQVWQGDLYPRWLQTMNAGFGSPTFFFYPPVPYYITSLFSPLVDSVSGCYALSVSSLVALIASGLAAYFWLKEITSATAAAIASVLYMAWPYHLMVDLYMRFAFAEYWSFVWMPLILYFGTRMVRGIRFSSVGLAISVALLALTHLPTWIIFIPVLIGYVVFMASPGQWKPIGLRLVLTLMMALGLSAIYWLPALTTQDSVSMAAMSTPPFQYFNNFLFTGPTFGSGKGFWRCLELTTLLTGGLALCEWRSTQSLVDARSRREGTYWMIVAMVALFMTLPFSELIWNWFPPIQRIQFPWRFNAVLTVAIAPLIALSKPQLKIKFLESLTESNRPYRFNQPYSWIRIGFLVALVLALTVLHVFPLQGRITVGGRQDTALWLFLIALALLGIAWIKTPINFAKQKSVSISLLLTLVIFSGSLAYNREFFKRLEPSTIQHYLEVAKAPQEHRPRWFPQDQFREETLIQLSRETPTVRLESGQARWHVEQWRPRSITLQVDATTGSELTLHQFYYPEWTVRLEGRSPALPTHPSPLGLLQITVPAGQHQVAVTLDAGRQERLGQLITGGAMIGLLLYAVFARIYQTTRQVSF